MGALAGTMAVTTTRKEIAGNLIATT